MDFQKILGNYDFSSKIKLSNRLWDSCMAFRACASPAVETRAGGHRRLREPFPVAYASPGWPTNTGRSIWQLLIFDENHDFSRFQEIHGLAHFRFIQAIPGWSAAARSMAAGGAREAAGSVRGVAVGGPEAGGLLGMLSGMSIPIAVSSRSPQTDFPKIEKRSFRSTY